MIGDGRTDIVTGYEWLTDACAEKLAPHVPKQSGTGQNNPQAPQNALDIAEKIKVAIAEKLTEIRKYERGAKQTLEQKKDSIMSEAEKPPQGQDKHTYLFKSYVPALRQIGISLQKLQLKQTDFSTAVQDILKTIHTGKTSASIESQTLYVKLHANSAWAVGPAKASIPIVKFLVGREGFFKKNIATPRPVYEKRTLNVQDFKKGPNEYVEDDAGFMTRRYAYAEKSREGIDGLIRGNYAAMKGRFVRANEQVMRGPVDIIHSGQSYKNTYVTDQDYQADLISKTPKVLEAYTEVIQPQNASARTKGGFIEISDKEGKPVIINGYKRYLITSGPGSYVLPKGATDMSREEMLFINQELGSGPHQRGICLASTPKMIHGNKGEPFRSKDTVLVEVDLAQVPSGQELLFNLYSKEAQATTIGLKESRKSKRAPDVMQEHTNTSTAKNREIFLLELKTAYITRIAADANRQDWKTTDAYKQSLK